MIFVFNPFLSINSNTVEKNNCICDSFERNVLSLDPISFDTITRNGFSLYFSTIVYCIVYWLQFWSPTTTFPNECLVLAEKPYILLFFVAIRNPLSHSLSHCLKGIKTISDPNNEI